MGFGSDKIKILANCGMHHWGYLLLVLVSVTEVREMSGYYTLCFHRSFHSAFRDTGGHLPTPNITAGLRGFGTSLVGQIYRSDLANSTKMECEPVFMHVLRLCCINPVVFWMLRLVHRRCE
jgi:hypothetical protein